MAVPGIGPGIIRLIQEYLATGGLEELAKLTAIYPAAAPLISRLPRVTPVRLQALKSLGVETMDDLAAAVETGAVESIEGIGPTTAERWARILGLPPSPGSMPAHAAYVTSRRLASHMRLHLDGDEVTLAGSVRRLDEWSEILDLVVVTESPDRANAFLAATAAAAATQSQASSVVTLLLHEGIEARIHLGAPASAGSVLVGSTGPPEHVSELGIAASEAHPTEEEVYGAAGRAWIPAPARTRSSPPEDVITGDDLRGDLHLHSDWSPDGHMPVEGIVAAAIDRGYEYVAITDHTIGLRFGGLDAPALERQRQAIDRLRERFPEIVILQGAEINIDRQGRPDLDDVALAALDFVVAGCHSDFDLAVEIQTARIVTALAHPSVRVLAHPTGRRIGIRPGFDLDIDAVIEAARHHDVALEVNGHRDRMDLSASFAERAARAGAVLAANGDAHRFDELDNVGNAVGVMQRAGVRPASVVNTRPVTRFLAWLQRSTGK